MPFKWGTAGDITKVKVIKDGVVLDEDAKKVVFNSVTIFEKSSTYVVTPYIKWNWTGKLYMREELNPDSDPDTDSSWDEYLQQSTAGTCYLEVGIDITKNGVAYTPTSSDNCSIAYNMSIGTIMKDESNPPTYNDQFSVHVSGNSISDGKSARITKSWSSNTQIDVVYYNDSPTVYWFLVFRCALAQWDFKGHNAYFAQSYQQYTKAPRPSWSSFYWIPFPKGESRANFTATTFTA